jgi:hypothetical protein
MGELILEFLFRGVFGIILLPLWVIAASSVIWIVALFGKGTYQQNVYCGYSKMISLLGSILDGF